MYNSFHTVSERRHHKVTDVYSAVLHVWSLALSSELKERTESVSSCAKIAMNLLILKAKTALPGRPVCPKFFCVLPVRKNMLDAHASVSVLTDQCACGINGVILGGKWWNFNQSEREQTRLFVRSQGWFSCRHLLGSFFIRMSSFYEWLNVGECRVRRRKLRYLRPQTKLNGGDTRQNPAVWSVPATIAIVHPHDRPTDTNMKCGRTVDE